MNFPLFLVIVTAATGLYWLVDLLFFKRHRTGNEPIAVEYARQFFPVLFIVLMLRSAGSPRDVSRMCDVICVMVFCLIKLQTIQCYVTDAR